MENQILVYFYINVIAGISYTLPIPLFPTLAYSRGVNETMLGFIFAVYSISSVFLIPFSNTFISYFGRIKSMFILIFFKIISSLLFIYLSIVYNYYSFISISILARIIQGLSIEYINIIVFSLFNLSSRQENSKNLSFVEAATSLGYVLGTLLAFIFNRFGFVYPFLISVILDVIAFIITFFLKEDSKDDDEVGQSNGIKILSSTDDNNSINFLEIKHTTRMYYDLVHQNDIQENKDEELEYSVFSDDPYDRKLVNTDNLPLIYQHYGFDQDMEESENNVKKRTTFKDFMTILINPSILPIVFAVLLDYVAQTFFTPVFVIVMNNNFGLSQEASSSILSLMYLIYFISLRYVSVFTQFLPNKFLIAIGLVMNSISCLFLNPIQLFPQKWYLSVFGYCMLNLFAGFISITSLMELKRVLLIQGFSKDKASDTASSLYIFGLNIAELIGPMTGGILTQYYGFEFTCICVSIASIFFSIIFIIMYFSSFNIGSKRKKTIDSR